MSGIRVSAREIGHCKGLAITTCDESIAGFQHKDDGIFVFGFEASMTWLREGFEPERKAPVNPMKQALAMKRLLESPEIRSKADLASHLGISRARVTQTLNLLRLAPEIQKHILALPDDEAAFFTERRLRPLTQVSSPGAQIEAFHGFV